MSSVLQSRTDAELLYWSNAFSSEINISPEMYGLTAAAAAQYAAINSDYRDAYNLANNPSTKTAVAVMGKNMAKAALQRQTSLLSKIIDGTASVDDTQRIALGLRPKARPVTVPPPSAPPRIAVALAGGRRVTVRLYDFTSVKKIRPAGATTATVFSYVGTTPPTISTGWTFEGVTPRSSYEVKFPDSVPNGAQVWISAVWNNAKMQSGPASDPVSINIPGGGVSMAA